MADAPPVRVISANDSNSKEIYDRLTRLGSAFEEKYAKKPTFYGRAPGRVNLIGEHIDYCGYAVLPMAIEQDIVIAVAPNDSKTIHIANINPQFSDYTCPTTQIDIDKSCPQWHHYFLCGYKGILEHCQLDGSVGVDLMLDGSVPKSAGLSSSSAFVCCSALVTAHSNGKQLSKLELADVCQHCERYIGTEGGGMDQAISFLAEPGTAKLIEFNPLRTTDVRLPEGAVFVISNSCVESNKAATSNYNIRVSECRLATQLLAKAKGLEWRQSRKLGDLQVQLGVTLYDMLQLVKDTLHPEPYSKKEVCDILGVTPEELNQTSLNEKTWNLDSFLLYDRAHHVYSEANRVLQFKRTCEDQPAEALQKLGDLMNQSHASCAKEYDCSCPELDELTALARSSCALGSRLTGAGWGGCAVSLVPANQVEAFMKKMQEGYYAKDPQRLARVTQSLFATQPGGGATVYVN